MPEPPVFENYNITPSQDILAIRLAPESAQPEYALLHWGLVPFWSKTATTKFPLINARAEGIEKKPSFRGPFKHRRCLIPARGFYEWQQIDGRKQPYFFRPVDDGLFLLAGIWDNWQGDDGTVIESCAIITTEANAQIRPIHERMPVILNEENLSAWLDPGTNQQTSLALLTPFAAPMTIHPVNSKVNNPRHNGPDCVARISAEE
ncbi:SOS response-associated peptidase [Desulfobulbus alkaliphilus]|nr:SOS response-associated peptidase [Desulfobulbus alkaliphilus]MBM9538499.1 SOS response-associated peptidase [Desulfobulbus alkaliphilus]